MIDEELLSNLVAFVGAFGTPLRMKIAVTMMDGAKTVAEIADELNTPAPIVAQEIERMILLGFVYKTHIESTLNIDDIAIKSLFNAAGKIPLPASDKDRVKVLNAFIKNKKLLLIPANRIKRRIVLEAIADLFDLDREYPESEVNSILIEVYEDYCELRRALVDEGLLMRNNGIYRKVA